MSLLPPAADLGTLLPLQPNGLIFTVKANLDSTYLDNPSTQFSDAIDLGELPQMVYRRLQRQKNGWATVGVSVYQSGIDIVYQSFFWVEGTPQAGQALDLSGDNGWKVASPPVRLNDADPQDALTKLVHADWCNVTAAPIVADWSVEITNGTLKMDPVTYDSLTSTTYGWRNTSTTPVVFNGGQNWAYQVLASSSVTNTVSLKAGIKLTWSYKVGTDLGGGTTWGVELDFETDYTRTKVSTNQTTTTLTNLTSAQVSISPGQTAYLTITGQTDNNATGTLTLDAEVTGTINNQTLTGDFIAAILKAMDPNVEIVSEDTDSVKYQMVGTVSANLLQSATAQVSTQPPAGVTIIWSDIPTEQASSAKVG